MRRCLFCCSDGPFTKREHILPEALGNDDLVLVADVCDKCNQYFGSKIESFVLGKTPIAFWRAFLGIRGKDGQLPHVDLSQPAEQRGCIPATHRLHDNLVGFTCHDDYSVSVDIEDDRMIRAILEGRRDRFTFVFTPLVLSMMGRFLCKVGIELVCLADPALARSERFDLARAFARRGQHDRLWPIFHCQTGSLDNLKQQMVTPLGKVEEVLCYDYQLVEVAGAYTLLALTVGIDTWVICLNDPYPTPVICQAFPERRLSLIYYSPEEIRPR